jgi:hypothetical protein
VVAGTLADGAPLAVCLERTSCSARGRDRGDGEDGGDRSVACAGGGDAGRAITAVRKAVLLCKAVVSSAGRD